MYNKCKELHRIYIHGIYSVAVDNMRIYSIICVGYSIIHNILIGGVEVFMQLLWVTKNCSHQLPATRYQAARHLDHDVPQASANDHFEKQIKPCSYQTLFDLPPKIAMFLLGNMMTMGCNGYPSCTHKWASYGTLTLVFCKL